MTDAKAKFALANQILRDKALTSSARLVGWYLADHINTRRGYAWPSQAKIAADLGISERSIRSAIKPLNKYFDIARTKRRGRANEYRLAAKIACNGATITGKNCTLMGQNLPVDRAKFAAHPLKYPLNDPLKGAARPRIRNLKSAGREERKPRAKWTPETAQAYLSGVEAAMLEPTTRPAVKCEIPALSQIASDESLDAVTRERAATLRDMALAT
jgi:biotin operon repressor